MLRHRDEEVHRGGVLIDQGAAKLSFEETAAIFTYRNPRIPMTAKQARAIHSIALGKLRAAIVELGDPIIHEAGL